MERPLLTALERVAARLSADPACTSDLSAALNSAGKPADTHWLPRKLPPLVHVVLSAALPA